MFRETSRRCSTGTLSRERFGLAGSRVMARSGWPKSGPLGVRGGGSPWPKKPSASPTLGHSYSLTVMRSALGYVHVAKGELSDGRPRARMWGWRSGAVEPDYPGRRTRGTGLRLRASRGGSLRASRCWSTR